MLRYGTGSCWEAAQHSLGSQHSPRGSGWNPTPLTISHLIHKRINRLQNGTVQMHFVPDSTPLFLTYLSANTLQVFSSGLLWTNFTACLSSPLDAGSDKGQRNCRGWVFQVLHLKVRAGTARVCLWSNFSHFRINMWISSSRRPKGPWVTKQLQDLFSLKLSLQGNDSKAEPSLLWLLWSYSWGGKQKRILQPETIALLLVLYLKRKQFQVSKEIW